MGFTFARSRRDHDRLSRRRRSRAASDSAVSGRASLVESLEARQLLALTNGGFESGLTGWSSLPSGGSITTVTGYTAQTAAPPSVVYNAVEGTRFALLTAGNGNVFVTTSQTFNAVPGDKISGWAFFDAADTMPRNDDAYVAIKRTGSTAPFAEPFTASVATLGNNRGETPWTYWEYTFSTSGSFRVEAAVRNFGTNVSPSRLGIDALSHSGGFPIPPANRAPAANAGGPYNVAEGEPVTFQGSGSDADGGQLRYAWDLNGDNNFNDAVVPNPTFTAADLARFRVSGGTASYNVRLRVTDIVGASTIATAQLNVANVAPQNLQISGPDQLKVGQSGVFSGSATDPGADPLQFSWAVTRDGAPVMNAGSSFMVFRPMEPGEYLVTLYADDGEAISSKSVTVLATPNHPPEITEFEVGPATVYEGGTAWVRGKFNDPDLQDVPHQIEVNWGDGVISNATQGLPYSVVAAHVNPDNDHTYFLAYGSWEENEGLALALGGHLATIGSQAEQDWAWGTFNGTYGANVIHIGLNDRNQEGQFTWISGEPVDYTNFVVGEPNDYGGNEDQVAMWDAYGGQWNDFFPNYGAYALIEVDSPDAVPGPDEFVANALYLDDAYYADPATSTFPVSVTITDDGGLTGTASGSIQVLNVAPTVGAFPELAIDEGGYFVGYGTFFDPGIYDQLTATIDYGDGTGEQYVQVDNWNPSASKGFYLEHFYPDDGNYTLTLTVTDDDAGTTTTTMQLVVRNVAPSATDLAVSPSSVDEGGSVTLTGTVREINPVDAVTVEIDWGDGRVSTREFAPGSEMTLGESHVYVDDPSTPGSDTYDVVVTVRDDDGGEWTNVRAVEGSVQWSSGEGANGHWYLVIDTPPGGVHAAEEAAAALGGHLVTILSAEEQQFLNNSFLVGDGLTEAYWIGVSDAPEEGVWRWNSGELSYHRWAHYTWGYQTDEYGNYLYDENGELIPAPYPGPTSSTDPEGYSNWYTPSEEPNDWGGGEDYAVMNWHYRYGAVDSLPGQWNDEDEYEPTVGRAIVEFDQPFEPLHVTVNNVAPTLDPVAGPTSGVRGQYRAFSTTVTDPGADGWTATIDYGDGTVETVSGEGPTLSFGHVYAATGDFAVTVTVDDGDGGSATGATSVKIYAYELQADPDDASKTVLAVGGTTGADNIEFTPSADGTGVTLLIDGVAQGTFAPTGGLVVFGQAGDDRVHVAGAIGLPATIFGGAGNDDLNSGNGGGVVVGGDGDDKLLGGSGRDVLIGGRGADRIVGNSGDDVLVAGYTAYDTDDVALAALAATWRAAGTYAERVAALTGGGAIAFRSTGPARTVFDDGATDALDTLTGSAGEDLFLVNGTGDRVSDQANETVFHG